MTVYFVDSSALAKRYLQENGSRWVRSQVRRRSGNLIFISLLTTVEVVSVLNRRVNEQSLSLVRSQRMEAHFLLQGEQDYFVIDLSTAVLSRARGLLREFRLRTLDAIQLASALQVQEQFVIPPTFMCADQRLCDAAIAVGLPIANPNHYPTG